MNPLLPDIAVYSPFEHIIHRTFLNTRRLLQKISHQRVRSAMSSGFSSEHFFVGNTPRKTNMTMKNSPFKSMYLPLKNGGFPDFQPCWVFQGSKQPNPWRHPSSPETMGTKLWIFGCFGIFGEPWGW